MTIFWALPVAATAAERYAKGQKLIGIFNFTEWEKYVTLSYDTGEFTDLLGGETKTLQHLAVPAYGCYYMEQRISE